MVRETQSGTLNENRFYMDATATKGGIEFGFHGFDSIDSRGGSTFYGTNRFTVGSPYLTVAPMLKVDSFGVGKSTASYGLRYDGGFVKSDYSYTEFSVSKGRYHFTTLAGIFLSKQVTGEFSYTGAYAHGKPTNLVEMEVLFGSHDSGKMRPFIMTDITFNRDSSAFIGLRYKR